MHISEMVDVAHHLGVGVWNSVRHIHFIAWKGEFVVEAELVVRARLLRIQIVDFFGDDRVFITDIEAAVLIPTALTLIQPLIHLSRPN